MNAKDRRLLISKFGGMVARTHPEFLPFRGTSTYMFPSHYYFSYQDRARGLLVLDLYINQKTNTSEFTVQFGWSRLSRLPEVLSVHFYMDDVEAGTRRYAQPEYLQRVAMFLGNDTWWRFESVDPAECEKVLIAVEQLLRDKVIPYLVGALEFKSGEELI